CVVDGAERLGEGRDPEPGALALEDVGEGQRHGFLFLLLAGDRRGCDECDAGGFQVALAQRHHVLAHRRIVDRRRGASRHQGEAEEDASHPLSERFSTASAASRITSDIDGWAWQMRAMSSEEAPNSIATTASAMSSLARLPIACTPRIRSLPASARILMKPSGSSRPRARPLYAKGKRPAL